MAAKVGMERHQPQWASPLPWPTVDGPGLVVSRGILAVAQVSSLAAMAFCYFLAPQFAWLYALVAVGWFLGLAVPSSTAGPRGLAGQQLIAASPGRQHLPGSLGFTMGVAARYLAYFGWPALVAAVLPPPDGVRSAEPIVALACLSVAGALLIGVVTLAGPRRKNLARGVMFALATLALAATVCLPSPPRLPSPAVNRPE